MDSLQATGKEWAVKMIDLMKEGEKGVFRQNRPYDFFHYESTFDTRREPRICCNLWSHALYLNAELKSDFAVESIRREIEIMKHIDHPSCVQV